MKKHMQRLNNKSADELSKDLNEARTRLSAFRFDLAQGKMKNVGEIQKTRKMIARILTVLNK
ncbi:50S ribosomal protein L29 [Candidatus Wolfebacteria bacterium]|nr:50S ribosomal protein L29 [Candidatus Wolfebacteria bacterium]